MYADLGILCKEMHITDVMGIVSVIRNEILAKTGCNASVGVGKLKFQLSQCNHLFHYNLIFIFQRCLTPLVTMRKALV